MVNIHYGPTFGLCLPFIFPFFFVVPFFLTSLFFYTSTKLLNCKNGRVQSTQPECLLDPANDPLLCAHHYLFGLDPVVYSHPFGEKVRNELKKPFFCVDAGIRDGLIRNVYHASTTDPVLVDFCDCSLWDRGPGRLYLRPDFDLLHCVGPDMLVRIQLCSVFPRLDVDPLCQVIAP